MVAAVTGGRQEKQTAVFGCTGAKEVSCAWLGSGCSDWRETGEDRAVTQVMQNPTYYSSMHMKVSCTDTAHA